MSKDGWKALVYSVLFGLFAYVLALATILSAVG